MSLYDRKRKCKCGRDEGDSCDNCMSCKKYTCGKCRPPLINTDMGLYCAKCLNKDKIVLIYPDKVHNDEDVCCQCYCGLYGEGIYIANRSLCRVCLENVITCGTNASYTINKENEQYGFVHNNRRYFADADVTLKTFISMCPVGTFYRCSIDVEKFGLNEPIRNIYHSDEWEDLDIIIPPNSFFDFRIK